MYVYIRPPPKKKIEMYLKKIGRLLKLPMFLNNANNTLVVEKQHCTYVV